MPPNYLSDCKNPETYCILVKPVSSGVASRSSCFPPEGGFSVGRRGTKSGGLGVRQPGKTDLFLLLRSKSSGLGGQATQ